MVVGAQKFCVLLTSIGEIGWARRSATRRTSGSMLSRTPRQRPFSGRRHGPDDTQFRPGSRRIRMQTATYNASGINGRLPALPLLALP